MRPRLQILIVFVMSAALAAGSLQSADDDSALLARCADHASLRKEGPFFLQASLTFTSGKKTTSGDLRLFWMNESKWREEINLGSYHEVRVGGEAQVWRERKSDDLPQAIWQLRGLLSMDRNAIPGSQESVGDVRNYKADTGETRCVQIVNGIWKSQREICIDPANLVIVHERETQQGITVERHYSDAKKAGARQFPAKWISKVGDAELVVRVDRLILRPPLPPELFTPLPTVRATPGCLVPDEPPELMRKVSPDFRSLNARAEGKSAIFFYGTIEQDGSVSITKGLGNNDSWANQSAMEALRQWKYKPARCQGKPVPVQSFFRVQLDPY
jgi:hypothetical protein